MKKTDFEQEVQRMTLVHTHAIEMAKLTHAHAMERQSAQLAGATTLVRGIGEEVRSTATTQMAVIMPLYEHMGAEATAAHLRLQIEQSVAMLITLGEKGLDAMVKIQEVQATKSSAQEARDLVNLLTGTLLDAIEDISYSKFREYDEEDGDDGGYSEEEDETPSRKWSTKAPEAQWYTAYTDGASCNVETISPEDNDMGGKTEE
jgi:hypothetical protein